PESLGGGILDILPELQPLVEKAELTVATNGVPLEAGISEDTILLKGTGTERIGSILAPTKDTKLVVAHGSTMGNLLKPVRPLLVGPYNGIVLVRIHNIVIFGRIGIRCCNVVPRGRTGQ